MMYAVKRLWTFSDLTGLKDQLNPVQNLKHSFLSTVNFWVTLTTLVLCRLPSSFSSLTLPGDLARLIFDVIAQTTTVLI